MEFKKIQSTVFFTILISISLLFCWIVRPYLYPIFWAAVIAVIFHPLFLKLSSKIKSKSLASGITLIIIILIFLVPLSLIVFLVISQTLDVFNQFGNQETFNKISEIIQGYLQNPHITKIIGSFDVREKLFQASGQITAFIYNFAMQSGQNTLRFLIQLFVMLYTLFYFIKDGEVILKKFMYLLPLGDKYEKQLYARFVSTIRATLKGSLLIGTIQGTMGGITMFMVGIPGSAFWGMIMIICSLIPNVGAAIILTPAAIIMLMLGNIWQAIVLGVMILIVGVTDNFLRGPLIGKDTQMHPLFIFFSTLGGLIVFGLTGVIIGPVITAFFLSIWGIYVEKYKKELALDD